MRKFATFVFLIFSTTAAFPCGESSGTAPFDDGTAIAPSINFASDPSTGIYRSGTGEIAFASSGTLIGKLTGTGLNMSPGSLTVGTSSGFLTSNSGLWTATAMASDQVLIATGATSATATTINDCKAASSALTYNQSTHSWGCNTISGGGSGTVNTGVAGYFGYYPSNGTTVDDQTVLYTDGTNVGIGTSSPAAILDVKSGTAGAMTMNGTATISGNVGIGTTSTSQQFSVGSSSQLTVSSVGALTTTGAVDFNGAASTKISQGASPTISAAGHVGIDTTGDQYKYYGTAARTLSYTQQHCFVIESLASTDDNYAFYMANEGQTVVGVSCNCRGSCATPATFTLEDRGGNAMTITGTNPTCATTGDATYAAVTAGNTINSGEMVAFDVTNSPTASDTYAICLATTTNAT